MEKWEWLIPHYEIPNNEGDKMVYIGNDYEKFPPDGYWYLERHMFKLIYLLKEIERRNEK